jgi:hypothetical protein
MVHIISKESLRENRMKELEQCTDCNTKADILISVFNYGLFGEKVYFCESCYNAKYKNSFRLIARKPKKPRPSYLKVVK